MILKNLRIKNFRLFENLEFNRLGRINLLVGKNNSGKSTVLEALRIYAKVGSPKLLQELLKSHDEAGSSKGRFRFENFFPDNFSPTEEEKEPIIYIGNTDQIDQDDYLTMKNTYFIMEEPSIADSGDEKSLLRRLLQRRKREVNYQDVSKYDKVRQALKIEARNSRLNQDIVRNQLDPPGIFNIWLDYRSFDEDDYEVGDDWLVEHNVTVPYCHVPSGLLPKAPLKAMWNKISLTPYSKKVIEALQLINPKVEALAFIPIDTSTEEVPFVNIGQDQPVPLSREGEGMLRLLQLVLSMINAKGGLLLIDEFENGLHYGIQPRVWQLLIELATQLNVQVFATTHDWDCVKSLQQAVEEVSEQKPTEVFLFHLGRSIAVDDNRRVIATEYNGEELRTATQAELEVR